MKITLHFWQGGAGPFEPGMAHERVFVCVAGAYRPRGCGIWDDGCLGFWEQTCRQTVVDKHISRGVWSAPQWFSGEVSEATVLEAIGVGDVEIARADADIHGGLFVAVARKAQNGYPTWELTTPLDEAARLRSERDNAVFDLADAAVNEVLAPMLEEERRILAALKDVKADAAAKTKSGSRNDGSNEE